MKTFDLEIRDEKGTRRVALGSQECLRVGRSRQNDCVVHASGVSRNHCLLLRAGETWKLVDLKSSNASFVRGEPVHEAVLHPGDRIRLGLARLWFLDAGAPSPPGRPVPVRVKSKASGAIKRPSKKILRAPGKLPDEL